jgi:TolB-like protein/Tfp pilus assembly protein PilF
MFAYRFGDFVLDINAHQLRCGQREISVQPKTFNTLLYLVERQGRLVKKNEFIAALWSDVAVTDGALVRTIVEVRRALGDDAQSPRFVQTIPGLGYKFIAPVNKIAAAVASERASDGRTTGIRSVVVLPFANLNADPDLDYFVDGMTDLLITDLGKISALRVISRTSAMCYRGTTKSLPEIGQQLNVAGAIEGAVLRVGDRVRITAQLIDTATDQHLWAESYERELKAVLQLQSDVARNIAAAVQIRLTPEELQRLSSTRAIKPDAHDAWLKARFFGHTRSEEGMRKSMECFYEAIQRDPACAPAYAGLADCYGIAGFFGHIPPKDAFPKMIDAAARALDIDPGLAEAHASLAAANLFYCWEWAIAGRELQLALQMNPNYTIAHEWYGWYLAALGRVQESVVQMERTRQMDPLSLRCHAAVGMSLYFARRHEEAIEKLQEGLDLDRNFPDIHCTLGLNFQQLGRLDVAIHEFQIALDLSGRSVEDLASLGHVYGLAKRHQEAWAILSELGRISERRYVSPAYCAAVHAGLDDRAKALELLDQALHERSGWLVFLRVDPWWDNLRGDERFDALTQSVVPRRGLCQV